MKWSKVLEKAMKGALASFAGGVATALSDGEMNPKKLAAAGGISVLIGLSAGASNWNKHRSVSK